MKVSVVQWLDADTIAGKKIRLVVTVVDAKSEHAIKVFEHVMSKMLISLEQNFCVGLGAKGVAFCGEGLAKFLEVVDLAIENDLDRVVRGGHGLAAMCAEINDGKPAMSE